MAIKTLSSQMENIYYPESGIYLRQDFLTNLNKYQTSSNSFFLQEKTNKITAINLPLGGYSLIKDSYAKALALCKDKTYDLVILFYHHKDINFSGFALTDFDILDTIVGKIPLFKKASNSLIESSSFQIINTVYEQTFAFEMALVLLKITLQKNPFAVLPITIGDINPLEQQENILDICNTILQTESNILWIHLGNLSSPDKKTLDDINFSLTEENFNHLVSLYKNEEVLNLQSFLFFLQILKFQDNILKESILNKSIYKTDDKIDHLYYTGVYL